MWMSLSHDLRWQLLSLYILTVALVFAAGLIFASATNENLTAETKFTDLALAQAIAEETQASIQRPFQAVQYLAAQPGVQEADPAQMAALFEIVLKTNPDYNLVYRHDGNATMVYHYPEVVSSTVGINYAFRPYSQDARTTHSPFVSTGRISATTLRPVATIVMPLWEGDQYLGIVAINIELQALSKTLSDVVLQQKAKPHLNITIIDQEGNILGSLEPSLLLTNVGGVFPHLAQATFPLRPGNSIELDHMGRQFLFSYAAVDRAGWSVVVSRPTDVAFATTFGFQRGAWFLMALYLGIGLLFWLVLSRRMISPIQSVTKYLRGRPLETPIQHTSAHPLADIAARPDQLGHLGQSVIDGEKIIAARLNELTTLLETSTAVTSSLDVNTVLNNILAQVEQILKIDKSAIVAYDKHEERFRVSAGRNLSGKYMEHMSHSDSHDRLAWQALDQNEIIQITDLAQHDQPERVAPGGLAEGVRAILIIPLKTRHAQPSVLVVYKTQPYSFTPREINLLSSFANHATMALENATLYAQSDIMLKEQTHRLEALIHSLGDGLVLEDLAGNIRYANRWMSDFTCLPLDRIKQSSIAALQRHLRTQAITTKAAQSGQLDVGPAGGNEIFALAHANRIRYLRSEIFEVTDYEEQVIGRGLLLQNITKDYELDRMKSLLISTVSHELRTPLASIKGYASTLLADDVQWDPAEQQEFLEIISREADRLNRLVNDLLDMSRLEAGRLKLSMVPCKLPMVVAKAIAQIHPLPQERLRLELPAELPSLIADPQRLEVVLRNLIENAAKYAGSETPITVAAAVANGSVVVQVSDHGPGIPEAHRPRIFDLFYRVDEGLTRQSGFGLGLAICQGFIQAQGGKIWLEPQPKGTCIAFSLPVQRTELAGD